MRAFILKTLFISIGCFLLLACNDNKEKPIVIGIIEPIQHTAMQEIVSGFDATLKQHYKKPYVIKVENAQNDMNLQRAIIQKMKDANYDIIVPIGTSASQMVVNMVTKQPIVSLASTLSEQERAQLTHCNVAIVHDEISSMQLLTFVHQAFPQIKNIMLIHSAAENVLPEVERAIKAGHLIGIAVSHRMVTTLQELYTVAQSLPSQYDAILILKDNFIASGASTLSLVAQKKKIPFIASDEGSVKAGADLALGVREKQIGVEGGKLAAAILQGSDACKMPIVEMTTLSVFINEAHPVIQANKQAIQQATHNAHYSLQFLSNEPIK